MALKSSAVGAQILKQFAPVAARAALKTEAPTADDQASSVARTIGESTAIYPRCSSCSRSHAAGPCPPAPDDRQGIAIGSDVGEYRVTRLIGSGGMGMVYAGVHPILQRHVAIKVMVGASAHSEESSLRFLQEARATVALRHRNIVDVFAFGRLPDGRDYLVMELVDGHTVRALVTERGGLPLPLVRVIMRGLLSALDAAERRGIVHRDIKPENVMVTGALDGRLGDIEVKVLDFGLAKYLAAEEAPMMSRLGLAKGTPAYMSPEQCRATATVDGRADIYAAGVVLYEMLAGRHPFVAQSAVEIMNMHISAQPPPLSRYVEVAPELEALVRKAMSKRPEDRFQNAADMLEVFEMAMGSQDPARSEPALPLTSSGLHRRSSQGLAAPTTQVTIPPMVTPDSSQPAAVPPQRRSAMFLVVGGLLAVGGALMFDRAVSRPGHFRPWPTSHASASRSPTGKPLFPIPVPALPRVQVVVSAAHLDRVFKAVQREAARAGVPEETTDAITGPLRRVLEAQPFPEVYPVGIFYFIVESQSRGQDRDSAAQDLMTSFSSRRLHDLSLDERLPAVDTSL
jgi:serine/threonine protein kinase